MNSTTTCELLPRLRILPFSSEIEGILLISLSKGLEILPPDPLNMDFRQLQPALLQTRADIYVFDFEWLASARITPAEFSEFFAQRGLQNTRLILCFEEANFNKAIAYPCDDYVAKPLRPRQMVAAVRKGMGFKPVVLMIDDDPFILNTASLEMFSPEFELQTASDGKEGLQKILETFPDLIITDINMPGLDGFQLIQALRSQMATRQIPVLVMSSSTDVGPVEKALSLGVVDYVIKPFEFHELLSKSNYLVQRQSRHRQNIFVVEDCKVTAGLLRSTLEKERFMVSVFDNAREALEKAKHKPPDLITTDYFMPGMDGWQFCRQLKLNQVTRFVPLIMISSGDTEVSYKKARVLGVNDYLIKPFNPMSLISTVNHVLLKNELSRQEERRRAMEAEVSLGKDLQLKLMPEQKYVRQGLFDLRASWEPAKEMGGDFYSYFSHYLAKGIFLVAIADVSGKGLPSALVAAAAQAALQSGVRFTRSPGTILEGLNEFVIEARKTERFVTCFVVAIDFNQRRMTYACAGHKGMFLLRAQTKEVVELVSSGMPCGMMENEIYPEEQIAFSKGDKLVLYTDGVLDAVSPKGEPMGKQKFKESVLRHAELPNEEFHRALMEDLLAHIDSAHQADDITLIPIEFL